MQDVRIFQIYACMFKTYDLKPCTNMFDKILNINVMIVVSFEFQVLTPKLQ